MLSESLHQFGCIFCMQIWIRDDVTQPTFVHYPVFLFFLVFFSSCNARRDVPPVVEQTRVTRPVEHLKGGVVIFEPLFDEVLCLFGILEGWDLFGTPILFVQDFAAQLAHFLPD